MSRVRYIGVGKESVYGDAVAATRFEDAICSILPDQNWLIPTPVAKRAYDKRARGLNRTQGNIGDFDVVAEGIIGELMLGCIGDVNTTNPYAGVYLHEFDPVDTIPSYTLRLGVEQTQRILPGCLVEQLTWKYSAGQFMKVNALIFSGFNTGGNWRSPQPLRPE